MVRPKRISQHSNLQEAIKETAYKQMSELGASALSLRRIARELKITAPAIYNYYPSRDDLVTALIVDAFQSLGDSQLESIASIPADDHPARLRSLGLAYRQWALAYPQRYQLIFGTPISEYQAPEEVTTPAAARSLSILIGVLQAAYLAGKLRTEHSIEMTAKFESMLSAWQAFGAGADPFPLYLALSIWSRVHGCVSLEIGGQFPPFLADPGELFRYEIDSLVRQFIAGD